MNNGKYIIKKVCLIISLILMVGTMPHSFYSKASYTTNKTEIAANWFKTEYGTNVFYEYKGTETDVSIPAEITSLDYVSFSTANDTIQVLRIPATLKYIGTSGLYSMDNLRYVVFEGSDTTFDDFAIYDCDNLTNFVGPSGSNAEKYAETFGIKFVTTENTQFYKPKVSLLKGDTFTNVLLNNLSDVTSITSSKPSVVQVKNSDGQIKAKKAGKAVVTVTTSDGNSYKYTVKISEATVDNRVAQIKKMKFSKGMTRLEKAKEAHNWLIENVCYDYKNYQKGTIPRISYTAEGALLKHKSVCQGYALAYKKLMDAYGIPCVMVVGTGNGGGHAWNMVQLGKQWYHVDVTWDDPIVNGSNKNTSINYNYFLKSSKYMTKDHRFDKSAYPKCKSRKYDNATASSF